jgi:MFS family permease
VPGGRSSAYQPTYPEDLRNNIYIRVLESAENARPTQTHLRRRLPSVCIPDSAWEMVAETRPVHSKRKVVSTIVRVCVGNCLEAYDLLIFGYFATEIGHTYFPSANPYASLLATFATFGAGYLMRPLGAFILGAYIDRAGRRRGLMVPLTLMAIGTLSIALTPGYNTIGLLSPAIVVAGRLLQGFSAGAEQGGVSVYLAEAPSGRLGFYVSWQPASTQISAVLAASFSIFLTGVLFLIGSVPEHLRTLGFSVAYSMAAVLGGFTPAIDIWLIHATADRAMWVHGWEQPAWLHSSQP